MAAVLRKLLPLASPPTPKKDDHESSDDSNSFQIDYSFANEYKGPLIANLPRADPVEIDQIPTALPVSFSSLSRGVSYPVVQPLVKVTKKKKKNGFVDSAACPSVVLKPHHVVSGSSASSSEVTLDVDVEDSDGEDSSIGGNGNRVRFVVPPSQGSEGDESSYYYDGEESVTPTPRAERKGKKGSCYRCLMGNRFTEKEVCIVCHAKYCFNCVRRAMGAMPEGRKCVSCIGLGIDESNRRSLGKCSRMLKRVLTDSELKQVMSDEMSCRANQMPSRLIAVNGKPLNEDELFMLQNCPHPPKKLKPGDYWYDKVAGYWGKVGEKPCHIISPDMKIGGSNIKKEASNGDTEICINNREITKTELMMLKVAVEPNVEPISNKKRLNKLLLIGNDTCGATTIYKQARSLYGIPFSEDDRERIKFIIQTNLYAYLAMVLEAHKRFEEEMNNNHYTDQTGDAITAITVSSISPRLKHFADWLLKEKEDGNLMIFPASSRENAQTVADLWRVPAIQDTYKLLRDTFPRNAVYFLERILEVSRSEYEPSDMDILQAEGLSSMEGLSCVDFSFPSTTQEVSLDTDDQHDPNMKYQLIRLNPRRHGENWKWLEMFEDADLVIFCVSLTDYGDYIEDGAGVLVNKMIANKQLFERMVTHPSLANKRFLLVLTKFDLLEEKIEEVPLRTCEWFKDFNPLISQNQTSRHNPPMAQRAFHYVGYQFKRLHDSLVGPFSMRGRTFRPKLFVSQVSLESDTVDNAMKYAREILKWHVEETSMIQETSTISIDASLSS
ncbi:hypothetical protein HID58_029726 [Brassica napus]|uniref:Uncharacterized protein n=1 Tax=Brassica napus TaxID=3708 RepID=A0ABQ8CG10_BRANA|nr:hypothetical protein HID58_029726 [Brassica napus]